MNTEPDAEFDSDVSRQIDLCLEREAYHRDLLLRYREMRIRLERQIPGDAVAEMLQIASDRWQQTQTSET